MSFNDPQWGRSAGSDKPRNDEQENQQRQDQNQPDPNDENRRREEADRQASDNDRNNMSDRRGNRNEGNDLDQLWNDFNRMVNSILGGQKDPRGIVKARTHGSLVARRNASGGRTACLASG